MNTPLSNLRSHVFSVNRLAKPRAAAEPSGRSPAPTGITNAASVPAPTRSANLDAEAQKRLVANISSPATHRAFRDLAEKKQAQAKNAAKSDQAQRQAEIDASWQRVHAEIEARRSGQTVAEDDRPDPHGWQAIHRGIAKRRCTDPGWARAAAKVNAANGFPADDDEDADRPDPHGWRAIAKRVAQERSGGPAAGDDDRRAAGWKKAAAAANRRNGIKD